jgi:hypothetical protein
MAKKIVGRKYIYFYNRKTKKWMKAKRLKNGKIKIIGKTSRSQAMKARK